MGSREFRALDEHTFLQNTETRLDEFLAQGREVLDNLVDQRNILKGTQRRILDVANTLGLSRDVIGWIEKRRCVYFYVIFSVQTEISLLPSVRRTRISFWAVLSSRSFAFI
jgi:Golgi SNAP receptor complex protein 2